MGAAALPPSKRRGSGGRGHWLWVISVVLLAGSLLELYAVVERSIAKRAYLTASQRCRPPARDESLPQLKLAGRWEGGGGSRASRQQVTLLTQMNLERLDRLENQCRTWPHPLAVAVYVPLLEGRVASVASGSSKGYTGLKFEGLTLEAAKARVEEFHKKMRATPGVCDLRINLYTETLADRAAVNQTLYPVNALRNRALQMVDTEAVLQLDVDFVVSRQFAKELSTKAGWSYVRHQLDSVSAIVLPAFEPNRTLLKREDEHVLRWGKEYVMQGIQGGKKWVHRELHTRNKTLVVFGMWHSATKTDRWLRADDYFGIDYTDKYEPYTIMLRKHVPWYDERFRGYHFNKIVGYAVMAEWGVTFSVHPRAYVIHIPHPKTANQFKTDELGWLPKFRALYESVRQELASQAYYPVTSFASACPLQPPLS